MKLTKKGMSKVENCIWCDFDGYNEYDTQRCLKKEEFTQEDILDCVTLSIAEAQAISVLLYKYAYLNSLQTLELDPEGKEREEIAKCYEPLNEKIGKAMNTLSKELKGKINETEL